MAGGIVTGVILAFLPQQTKLAKRLSMTILVLSLLYPILIVLLYVRREHLGESYAYLILGAVLGIFLGIIAGIIVISWLVIYVRGIMRLKESRGT
jgi:MFS-type transporter involved in bile tolerance (Atg22 family)